MSSNELNAVYNMDAITQNKVVEPINVSSTNSTSLMNKSSTSSSISSFLETNKVIIGLVIFLVLIVIWHCAPSIDFVSYDEFVHMVKREPYFRQLNEIDLKYRDSQSCDEYIQKYLKSYRSFCPSQRLKLYKACYHVNKILPNKLKLQWKFAQLKEHHHIENGFAHTIQDTIVLVSYCLDYPMERLMQTLIHEAVHIYQRHNQYDKDLLLTNLGIYREIPPLSLHNNADVSLNVTANMPSLKVSKLWRPLDTSIKNNPSALPNQPLVTEMSMPTNSVANPDHDGGLYYKITSGKKQYLDTQYSMTNFGGDVENVLVDSFGNKTPFNTDDGILYRGQPNEYMAELITRVLLQNGYVNRDQQIIIQQWLYT